MARVIDKWPYPCLLLCQLLYKCGVASKSSPIHIYEKAGELYKIKHLALHRYVDFLWNQDEIRPHLYTKRLYTVAYKFCVKL